MMRDFSGTMYGRTLLRIEMEIVSQFSKTKACDPENRADLLKDRA
jgi:hypothetical protein